MEIKTKKPKGQTFSLIIPGILLTLTNPFNLVRFRMQTMPQLLRQGTLTNSYHGCFDCMLRVVREEGVKAFWKGNLANLLRFYPSETINFFMKQTIQKMFKATSITNSFPASFKAASSGILGGWLSFLLLYPFKFSHLHLSNDIHDKQGGIIRCLKTTVQHEGISGIYKGALVSFVGVGIYRGTYFGVFDSLKYRVNGYLEMFAVGYLATFLAILLTYPSDTVRQRIMMTACQNYKYSSYFDCCLKMFRSEGFKGFFRGGVVIGFQSLTGAVNLCIFERLVRGKNQQQKNI